MPTGLLHDIGSIVHAMKLLHSRDDNVKLLARKCLIASVRSKIKTNPSVDDIAEYLNGSLHGNLRKDGDFSSIWSRARKGVRRLSPITTIRWRVSESEVKVFVNNAPISVEQIENRLRSTVRHHMLNQLTSKPDQRKAFRVTSGPDASNHFIRAGNFTRFADWRFIHRARLDVVPLNGNRRFGSGDKRCRRCGYINETLPHVLGHCGIHQRAITLRHDNILQRLIKAIPANKNTSIRINRIIPDGGTSLRPDIVIRNETNKTISIIDIACPFENGKDAFNSARREKLQKYRATANQLEQSGYKIFLNAFIVGALGGWDPANEMIMKHLQLNPKYVNLMRKLMVSDNIRWSRDIYVQHVSGIQQYK